ncbi:MAG: glucosyl-3-phosphoglycerate synthase [Actinomycetota bacterium]|nr:glucosyl-3-phosphoglycerate synthase [Actinomycetota bacterium]
MTSGDGRTLSVSVCLPALDEEATIGSICESVRRALIPGLVDELLVIDSGSTDSTAAVAAASGATVYQVDAIEPRLRQGGKGEALWKSVAVAKGDVVVWIDSDIRDFDPRFVSGLVEPLLFLPEVVMTKAYYRRPLALGRGPFGEGGGRVTELALRPLLNLLRPEMARIIQPLSGEYAMRRDVARRLPFFSGYGVDIALLMDVIDRYGQDAVRQVDLGTRVHHNRTLNELGRTSFEVMTAFMARLQDEGSLTLHTPMGETLRQFDRRHREVVTCPEIVELPAWVNVGKEQWADRVAAAI